MSEKTRALVAGGSMGSWAAQRQNEEAHPAGLDECGRLRY